MSEKSSKIETRDVEPLEIRGAFTPSSLNEENRTVDVTWTTGQRVLRQDWDGPYFEELSVTPESVRMDRLNSGRTPFLADHDTYSIRSVLGVVESASLKNSVGTARVRFVKGDPDADAVWNKVRQGALPNVSVGYRTYKVEKTEAATGDTPVRRAIDWEPFEISLVTVGADSTAQVRSATQDNKNKCVFVTPEESRTMADNEKTPTPAAPVVDVDQVRADAQRAERERISEINKAVRVAKLGEDFTKRLIDGNVSLDAARAQIFDELAKRTEETPVSNHAPVITVGTEQREKTLRGAEAAIIQRAGLTKAFEDLKEKGVKAFRTFEPDAGEFGGMRISRIAQEFLERDGVNTRGMNDDSIVAAALTHRAASGLSSASDFAVLLENVMYKTLLGGYNTAPDTWKRFCKTDTTQDFRPSNRYRTGSFGVLPVVAEGAEFVNTAIPDGLKASISVQTKGQMIAISRQALVNDDLGALTDVTGKFGRSAGLTIETDVYALINANSGLGFMQDGSTPFFSAGNKNISTSAALSVQAIDADRVKLASQQDISGNEYLDLRPKVLLVPIGLGAQARTINFAEYDVSQSNKFMVPNVVRGLFADVVDSPRLTGTVRYLFADPADAAAIVVAFLNGVEAPFMEQRLGWRTDGSEWKLRIDMKAQPFDPKGAVYNAGV